MLRRLPTGERRNHTPFSAVVGWSGLAAALSGVLFALWGYVDRADSPWYLDLAVIQLEIVVPLLFMVGLAGVYAKCGPRVSVLGVIGFIVGFGAAGWGVVAGVIRAPTMYRQLGERSWEHCTAQECGLWLSLLLSNPLTWLLVGLTMIGLSTIRIGRLRYWAYLLLVMALFGWVYQLTDDRTGIVDVRSIHVVFGVLFSMSWMALGYALWSSRNEQAEQEPFAQTRGVDP